MYTLYHWHKLENLLLRSEFEPIKNHFFKFIISKKFKESIYIKLKLLNKKFQIYDQIYHNH